MAHHAKLDQQNRVTEVRTDRLIETLKLNREKHIKEYQAAVAGYQEMAMKRLEEEHEKAKVSILRSYEKAQKKISAFDPEDPSKTPSRMVMVEQVSVDMPVPQNFSEAYDLAIEMADWENNETMKISTAEFQCFIRDNWDWKMEFETVSKLYNK